MSCAGSALHPTCETWAPSVFAEFASAAVAAFACVAATAFQGRRSNAVEPTMDLYVDWFVTVVLAFSDAPMFSVGLQDAASPVAQCDQGAAYPGLEGRVSFVGEHE